MQIMLKYKHILFKFCLGLIINFAKTQDNDWRCAKYKKLVFEEAKTFSYFLPGAHETSFIEDHCFTSTSFVAGGENAGPKEFAFAARLGHLATYNGYISWFCGGTLLSETFVLTAAHCFYTPLGEVNRVRLGELDFNSSTDDARPEDFNVKMLIEYPEYNNSQPYDDIGLVMLSSNVKFDRYKHPACFPKYTSLENSENLIAIGWGHKKFAGESSSILKPYTYADCQWLAEGPDGRERLPQGLQLSQICAGSPEKKDTCQGDSGGPLLVQHTKYPCMFIVVGITSFGVGGCVLRNVPAIYTNVSYYVDWISKYVR